ncbi:MAG TPA: hypothetical protein V6D17_00305 [Candidatus Obscuribacterales bacterium]
MTRHEFVEGANNGDLDPSQDSPLHDQMRIEHAQQLLHWGKNNFGRYDFDDVNNRLDRGEIYRGMSTTQSRRDYDMLLYLYNNYERLKEQNTGLFGHKDSISIGDLEKHLEIQQENAQKNAEARAAAAKLASEQAQSRAFMQQLLATESGTPNESLFRVLDGIKGGKYDNKVSKGDCERFLEEYDRRSRHADLGAGHFTPENRAYVQDLVDNWDSPAVRRLRGTWTTTDRDGRTEEHANRTITADSLREAAGISKEADLFGPFIARREQPVVAEEPVVKPELNLFIESDQRATNPEPIRPAKPSPEEIAEMRKSFENQVNSIANEAAIYVVKPGQGFDRVARDVLRADTGLKQPPERQVVRYSDEIAKMNGWTGRLDTSKMLQKHQPIRVRSAEWVKSQVDLALAQFDAKYAPKEK